MNDTTDSDDKLTLRLTGEEIRMCINPLQYTHLGIYASKEIYESRLQELMYRLADTGSDVYVEHTI